jgi:hypothetical protein
MAAVHGCDAWLRSARPSCALHCSGRLLYTVGIGYVCMRTGWAFSVCRAGVGAGWVATMHTALELGGRFSCANGTRYKAHLGLHEYETTQLWRARRGKPCTPHSAPQNILHSRASCTPEHLAPEHLAFAWCTSNSASITTALSGAHTRPRHYS